MVLKRSTLAGGSGPASNDFTISVGSSGYTYVDLSTSFPAGGYICISTLSDTTLDIYLIAEDGTSAGYANSTTASTSITASKAFNGLVIYGASNNDTLTFQFKYIFSPTNVTNNYTAAPPRLVSLTPSSLTAQNNTTVITGSNFSPDISVTFTGSDNVARSAKAITVNSSTQMTVTRPDNMPPGYSPYTVTASNPNISAPTTTNLHKLSNSITVGANPSWVTTTPLTQAYTNVSYSVTLSATDADGVITYSIISGSLPSSMNLNSSTGVISGTSQSQSNATFTVRATDAGGNYVDRAFTLPIQAVPSAPISPAATGYDSFALITWTTPTLAGSSAISGYTITASPGGATKTVGVVNSATINGLSNGTNYTFSVVATNSYGNSSASTTTATPVSASLRNTFTSNGTYTLPSGFGGSNAPLYATVYAIGGGGGGGGGMSGSYYGSDQPGGGGGGSGYVATGTLTVTGSVNYTVGSAGTGNYSTDGSAGSASVFSTLTGNGGGGGGYANSRAGGAGGSGGGSGGTGGSAGSAGGSAGAAGGGGVGGAGSGYNLSPGGGGGGGGWTTGGAGGNASSIAGAGAAGDSNPGQNSGPSGYGGGGGGGYGAGRYGSAGDNSAGTNGAQGVILVYY
jgi:hypothetical protein